MTRPAQRPTPERPRAAMPAPVAAAPEPAPPVLVGVALCSLAEVLSHDVVHVAGLVSHSVCFRDGGRLHFAHSERGELVSLHGQGVSVAIGKDGRVMAAMAGSPALKTLDG